MAQAAVGPEKLFRAIIAAGQNAIKNAVLINGGAAATLLAFMGYLEKGAPKLLAVFDDLFCGRRSRGGSRDHYKQCMKLAQSPAARPQKK